MFGSLRIQRSRLNKESRSLYHAQFCGTCHALREFSGRPTSLLTNYDVTFLHVIFAGLESNREVKLRPCTALPMRRVRVQALFERSRKTIAALTIALIDAKLRDNLMDGQSAARAGKRMLASRTRKAYEFLEQDGFPVQILRNLPEDQMRAESASNPTLDSLERPTAGAMAAIFNHAGVITGNRKAALARLGFALGRFLYLWDAVKDCQEDRRKGRFNALTAVYGVDWPKGSIRARLESRLKAFGRALDSLDLGKNADIARALLQSMQLRLRHVLRTEPARPIIRLSDARRQAAFTECCDCCVGCEGADACCSAGDCCCQGAECYVCCCPNEACCCAPYSGGSGGSGRSRGTRITTTRRNRRRGNPPPNV